MAVDPANARESAEVASEVGADVLSGSVELQIIPPTTRGTLWRLPPRPSSSRQRWCAGWGACR